MILSDHERADGRLDMSTKGRGLALPFSFFFSLSFPFLPFLPFFPFFSFFFLFFLNERTTGDEHSPLVLTPPSSNEGSADSAK